MGFLSGVLGAVKDDEAVKTYDEYMPETNKLNKVLEKLQSSIGSGREGLAVSVRAVREWLEGYEGVVTGSTVNVLTELTNLQDNLSGKYYRQINASQELETQWSNWTAALTDLEEHLNKTENNYVNMLDDKLKSTLLHEMKVIKKSVQVLKESAENGDLKLQAKLLDGQLVEQKERVLNQIVMESRELQDKLNDAFSGIFEAAGSTYESKNASFDDMREKIQRAKSLIEFCLHHVNLHYKTPISTQLDEIKKAVRCFDKNDMTAGALDGKCGLHKDIEGIECKVKEIENTYKEKLISVRATVDKAVDKAIQGLTVVDAAVKSDLAKLRDETIRTAIEKFDEQLRSAIETAGNGAFAASFFLRQLRNGDELKGFPKLKAWLEAAASEQGLYKTIAGLTGNGQFDRLKVIIDALPKKLTGSSRSSIIEAIGEDLESTVCDILKDIEKQNDAFQKIMKSYYEQTKGGERDGVLTSLIHDITRDHGGVITAESSNGYKVDAKKIAGYDDGGGHGARPSFDAALAAIIQKIKTLEKLPHDVGTTKENMEQLTVRLSNELTRHRANISAIESAIDAADQSLTSAIKNVETIAFAASEMLTRSIAKLQTELTRVTTDAFDNVIKHVQILYVNQHIADLSALRSLVDEQLKLVQGIIAKDRVTGVKGMLKTLSGVPAKYKGSKDDYRSLLTELGEALPTQTPPLKKDFNKFVDHVRAYYRSYLIYVHDDTAKSFASHPSPSTDVYSPQLKSIFEKLVDLLDHLEKPKLYAYDHTFVDLRNDLHDLLTALHPSSFADSPSPLLSPLKSGLSKFAEQLGHAYVNRYSGEKFGGQLWTTKQIEVKKDNSKQIEQKEDLTPEGRNCAKVCLTIVEMVGEDLKYLREQCETKWTPKKIYSGSSLGSFLSDCGYRVAIKETDQNGELQCKSSMNGEEIYRKLHERKLNGDDTTTKHLKECESNEVIKKTQHKKQENFDIFDLIKCLHHHLEKYYFVNHMATFASKKQPCSVYEMLLWLSGLPHNKVYLDLTTDGFDALFDKREKKESDSIEFEGITLEDKTPNLLTAYPLMIRSSDITNAIVHLTSYAPTVLTTILGTGDADTTYAVDFRSNYLKFSYPTRAEDCLHTLLDILRRIFPPLKFLHSQCDTLTSEHGWYRCKYGKDVQSAKLPCTKHSQTEPECQPRSPLMSFLGDCLPGHLPHHLTSVGCKAECKSCPKATPGQPCLTPLGFRGFSGSTKLGKELGNVLTKFFSNGVATPLLSFVPKPPSSLPEHFGFALYLVKGWGDGSKTAGKNGIQNYIEAAVKSQSIDLYSDTTPIIDALTKAYGDARGSHADMNHLPPYADVASLSMVKSCVDKANQVYCAPYLSTVCGDSYGYFAEKHANLYLSWAIYLPWTFWDLLNNLYNAFCSINCQDWGCRGCLRGDKCKKGEHGVVDEEKKSAICQCRSIVDCKGVAPTLYQFGFIFGEASTLNDKASPKTCSDFCSQLKKVLESKYFKKLFKECDNFLWQIRQPFSYLVLALWLLSLLYLIHIMVIRLDLLHIKSHLHSPSSHRIAAQSLLAVGRVNKLNKVFYLQP